MSNICLLLLYYMTLNKKELSKTWTCQPQQKFESLGPHNKTDPSPRWFLGIQLYFSSPANFHSVLVPDNVQSGLLCSILQYIYLFCRLTFLENICTECPASIFRFAGVHYSRKQSNLADLLMDTGLPVDVNQICSAFCVFFWGGPGLVTAVTTECVLL